MKAVKIEKPWEIAVAEAKTPVPGPGDALIRTRAAGICGSDVAAFRGANKLVSYPRIIGHELAGEVLSIP
ncbi:MAG: alcohol dehydrogenase catalytic domain-containing protein, partial [Clostridiales bacterium]|nr:alcohol dehydrogenase catalytic domain-containing protein [Clostridiales bacterium]